MMKKILSLLAVCALLTALAACQEKKPQCTISGTTNPRFNNKKIFLVPYYGPQDAAHVDSTVVEDCAFHFTTDSTMLAVLRVDYHFRTGVQDLLVITEPGEITAVVDSISHASGTPQNDSLDRWKGLCDEYNRQRTLLTRRQREAQQVGDSVALRLIQSGQKTLRDEHKQRTRDLAAHMTEGVLRDFLESIYPYTYQRQLPDGSIITIDADSGQPFIENKK